MAALGLLILGGGLILVYAGLRNVSIFSTFSAVLGGKALPTTAGGAQPGTSGTPAPGTAANPVPQPAQGTPGSTYY